MTMLDDRDQLLLATMRECTARGKENERLLAALGIARGILVSLHLGAQKDGNLAAASLIQAHINVMDRASQQQPRSE